jgi:hypothetical protein
LLFFLIFEFAPAQSKELLVPTDQGNIALWDSQGDGESVDPEKIFENVKEAIE